MFGKIKSGTILNGMIVLMIGCIVFLLSMVASTVSAKFRLAQSTNFVVTEVSMVDSLMCTYTFSERNIKGKLNEIFKSKSVCGIYSAGDKILFVKGMKDGESIKK